MAGGFCLSCLVWCIQLIVFRMKDSLYDQVIILTYIHTNTCASLTCTTQSTGLNPRRGAYHLSIANLLRNIPAKNYRNLATYPRVKAKNVWDFFYETGVYTSKLRTRGCNKVTCWLEQIGSVTYSAYYWQVLISTNTSTLCKFSIFSVQFSGGPVRLTRGGVWEDGCALLQTSACHISISNVI